MSDIELKYFFQLKKEIGQSLFSKSKVSSTDVSEWKGNDIMSFQDDLMQKINGRISEKWFYTHIKSSSDKLPRIDMLNMLSTYLDYKDWNDYKSKTAIKGSSEKKSSKKFILISLVAVIAVVGLTYVFSTLNQTTKYKFCFVDKDRLVSIEDPIEIEILRENESSTFLNCDKDGCIEIEGEDKYLKFIVRSAYYKSDTIIRSSQSNTSEQVKLLVNDYALMIHIFSKSEVKSWKERREQLKNMISENAQIIQINEGSDMAMEIYNRAEFIDKLTMPTSGLRDIKIIETKFQEGQIIKMRFIQKEIQLDE